MLQMKVYVRVAEFAVEIIRLANSNNIIKPIQSYEYITKASRPLNSRMSKNKLDEAGSADYLIGRTHFIVI